MLYIYCFSNRRSYDLTEISIIENFSFASFLIEVMKMQSLSL